MTFSGYSDYLDIGPYIVKVPVGVVEGSFNVTIRNDAIFENDEQFFIRINEDMLPNHYTGGSITEATVIIQDSISK